MHKLIKSEWYRFCHSGHYLFFLLLSNALILMMAVFSHDGYGKRTLIEEAGNFGEMYAMLLPMLLCTIISIGIGYSYSNRTAYYEIMDGNKISCIILSKIMVYSVAIIVSLGIPTAGSLIYSGIRNGTGGMESPIRYAVLSVIVIVHMISLTVMMSLIVKNVIAAAILPYLRYIMIEQLICVIFPAVFQSDSATITKSLDWFATVQLRNLAGKNDSMEFVIAVVGSFLIEFTICYAITYITFKKRRFS